jgi:SAM-dependent methyltransferase
MYRRGAPWESGPRPILVELCESGRIVADQSEMVRAIDLGCGSGADSVYLASRGFAVTGVDFSPVAIGKARVAADAARVDGHLEFQVGDLLALPNTEIPGPFDLLFDGGTIDDFPPSIRPQAAEVVTSLARSGATFVMWCFYANSGDLPLMRLDGPSRFGAPPIEPGEELELFGDNWDIERLTLVDASRYEACFIMTRR